MLGIVQHQQNALVGQVPKQLVLRCLQAEGGSRPNIKGHPERVGDGRYRGLRRRDRHQVHEIGAVRTGWRSARIRALHDDLHGGLDRQAGLAAAARPHQRDQAAPRILQQRLDPGQLYLPAHKRSGLQRQIVGPSIDRPERRQVLRQPLGDHLVDMLRADQVFQEMLAQVAQGDVLREMVAHEIGGRLAEQHLPAMAGGEQARDAIEFRAYVIVASLFGHTGMQSHAHLERADRSPWLCMQGTLRRQRRRQRV